MRHVLIISSDSQSLGPAIGSPCNEYGEANGYAQGLCALMSNAYITKSRGNGITCLMNAPTDLSMKNDDVLRVEIEVFRREHRDLDEAIRAMVERGTSDQLTLQRLKKRKLRLKDLIAQIDDRLTPDIIA